MNIAHPSPGYLVRGQVSNLGWVENRGREGLISLCDPLAAWEYKATQRGRHNVEPNTAVAAEGVEGVSVQV